MSDDWLREWADDCVITDGTYPYSAGQMVQAARAVLALLSERDAIQARVRELEEAASAVVSGYTQGTTPFVFHNLIMALSEVRAARAQQNRH